MLRWPHLLVLVGCLGCAGALSAQSTSAPSTFPWPDRGGPTFNGVADPGSARGVPVEWDEASGKNIAWKIPLQGRGHSTPIIGEGRLWLTSATEDGKQQFVYAISPEDGRVLHHRLLFENPDPEPLFNQVNTYASPSCVIEPGAAYVHFGSYGTARLDPETAEVVWQRRDIPCRHYRGPGSSPVLFGDLLILTFDGVDRQFLTALNKHSGQTVWLTPRTTDYGDLDADGQPQSEGDLRKAYSTPGLVRVGESWQVVSVGSRAAFSYDALSGQELWTIRHDDFNAAARPLFYKDLAILNTGSATANLLAVRLAGDTRGDVSESHVAWDRSRGNSQLASPILLGARVYMISATGVVACVEAASGEEVWRNRVDGNFVASPVAINDKLYFFNEEGTGTVLSSGDQFEVLAQNRLDEGMRSSPAVANGALYLRTFTHLYKIQAP